jgi:hypothetical protein
MVVFAVSGLWHGASWNFVIWGASHGLFMIGARVTAPLRGWFAGKLGLPGGSMVRDVVGRGSVFLLVSYAWIFFRAQNLGDALYVASHVFVGLGPRTATTQAVMKAIWSATWLSELGAAAIGVAALLWIDGSRDGESLRDRLGRCPTWGVGRPTTRPCWASPCLAFTTTKPSSIFSSDDERDRHDAKQSRTVGRLCALGAALAHAVNALLLHGLRRRRAGDYGVWNAVVQGRLGTNVIVIGSSRALMDVNCDALTARLGLSCFNLGLPFSEGRTPGI